MLVGGESDSVLDADSNADISGVILKTFEGRTTAPVNELAAVRRANKGGAHHSRKGQEKHPT